MKYKWYSISTRLQSYLHKFGYLPINFINEGKSHSPPIGAVKSALRLEDCRELL